MEIDDWTVRPLAVDDVAASYFAENLPADAYTFDNALLMRDVATELRQDATISAPNDSSTN